MGYQETSADQSSQDMLANVVDPSQTLWVWVTSLLTRMAADGEIPAMPTPTYGKIMSLADKAASETWLLGALKMGDILPAKRQGGNDCRPSNFGAPHFHANPQLGYFH